MKYSLFAIVACFISLAACTEEKGPSPDLGYDFFPLQVGKYWVYQVDSIVYDDEGLRVDTAYLFFREEIIDWRLNNSGDTTFICERFESYDSIDWNIKEVFSLERTRTQALRTENNLRFIKLIFPIHRNGRWDGHRFFNPAFDIPIAGENMQVFLDWEYRYSDVQNDIITISQADYDNNINLRKAEEQYARGIGLVQRNWSILYTQCNTCCNGNNTINCSNIHWPLKAERGFVLNQRLVAHN